MSLCYVHLPSSMGSLTQRAERTKLRDKWARQALLRHWTLDGGAVAALRRTLQFRQENDVDALRTCHIAAATDAKTTAMRSVADRLNMIVARGDARGRAIVELRCPDAPERSWTCSSRGCVDTCILFLEHAIAVSELNDEPLILMSIDFKEQFSMDALLFMVLNE